MEDGASGIHYHRGRVTSGPQLRRQLEQMDGDVIVADQHAGVGLHDGKVVVNNNSEQCEVIVENIGMVYAGQDREEAEQWFSDYADNHDTTLMVNGEIEVESHELPRNQLPLDG
jgi:hypothetical protein